MAIGPMQMTAIAGLRSAGPFAYANPFNGGVMGWVGDPTNEWNIVSYVMVALVLGTFVWLADGTVKFFESRFKTATLAVIVFVATLVVLAEGNKFDPTDYKELITAALFGSAFFSMCGYVLGQGNTKSKGK